MSANNNEARKVRAPRVFRRRKEEDFAGAEKSGTDVTVRSDLTERAERAERTVEAELSPARGALARGSGIVLIEGKSGETGVTRDSSHGAAGRSRLLPALGASASCAKDASEAEKGPVAKADAGKASRAVTLRDMTGDAASAEPGVVEYVEDPEAEEVEGGDDREDLFEIGELDVLRQIREFNEQSRRDDAGDAEDPLSFDEGSDADDESEEMSGMHLMRGGDRKTDVGRDDDAEESEDAEGAEDGDGAQGAGRGGKGSSGALVRSAGNIGSFIRAANREPMLSESEEHELAERLRNSGDIKAARRLVMSHLRLVVSVARGYTGYGLPLSDLIQEGNIGLMKAVKHFEPDMGVRLAAFAVHWIKAEIHEYVLRNWRMVKVATTKAQRKLFFKLRQNKKRLGWFTEHERNEVAGELGVSPHDVAEMETRLAGSDIGFDLDEDEGAEKGVSVMMSPSAYLEDENSNFAAVLERHDYASWELKNLSKALQSLDERSGYIIKRRWLDEDKATLQELSGELKVSIERVRQIESNALSRLKQSLVAAGVKDESARGSEVAGHAEQKRLVNKSGAGRVARDHALVAISKDAPKKRGRKKKQDAVAKTPQVIIPPPL